MYEEYCQSVILEVPWRKFRLPHEGRVLDVGCGPGWAGAVLAANGVDVVNLDIKPLAKNMVVGNALELPFVDRCFDGAVSLRTLQHIPDANQAVREIARVLRPRGFLFLALGNHWTYTLASARANPREHGAFRPSSPHARYYHLYTRREIRELLTANGFDVLGTRVSHFLPSIVARHANRELIRIIGTFEERAGESHLLTPLGSILLTWGRLA